MPHGTAQCTADRRRWARPGSPRLAPPRVQTGDQVPPSLSEPILRAHLAPGFVDVEGGLARAAWGPRPGWNVAAQFLRIAPRRPSGSALRSALQPALFSAASQASRSTWRAVFRTRIRPRRSARTARVARLARRAPRLAPQQTRTRFTPCRGALYFLSWFALFMHLASKIGVCKITLRLVSSFI